MAPNPAQLRYLADKVNTATPAQLVVMLYDRLGLDLNRAAEAQESGEPFAGSSHLLHAQQIIAELMSSLRADIWDGAGELSALYGFLLRELISCNATPDPAKIRKAAEIVSGLRAAWYQASSPTAVTPSVAGAGAWVS